MQAQNFRRVMLLASLAALVTGCSGANNPYAGLKGTPLVQAQLHVVTLVSDSDGAAEGITRAGWVASTLPPNYPQADSVEGSVWGVPEAVAAKARYFTAGKAGAPDIRLLVMPLAARGRKADADIDEAFFRNVLGADVPAWPLPGEATDKVRVQAWTYRVPDVREASRRLRENGIAVIYDAVAITTAYLGDHKTLAIRAPDGTVVQLIETASR